MSTRGLLNLALLAIAVALAAVIVLQPGLDKPVAAVTITGIDPQTVTHITLTRPAAAGLAFSRHGTHWQIDGTPVLPVDDFQIENVLALLQATALRSYPSSGLEPAKLGLEPAQALLKFDATELALGATDALEGLRYVRAGDRIHLVSDRYAHLLNAGAAAFVQRRLLPEDAQITALTLPGLALTRSDATHWHLQPEHPASSADDIQLLLRNWQQASAMYVSPLRSAVAGDTVTLTLQGTATPLLFTIVARQPDLVLARTDLGMQYHLPDSQAAALLALPAASTHSSAPAATSSGAATAP